MSLKCLDGLVGLIYGETNCPNFEEEFDNTSREGIFIDQDPLYYACQYRNGKTSCEYIVSLDSARREAYRITASDISAALTNKLKVEPASRFNIGLPNYGAWMNPADVPAKPYMRVRTTGRSQYASLRIKELVTMLSPIEGPFDLAVRCYKEVWSEKEDGAPQVLNEEILVNTWTVEVTASSTFPKQVAPIELPCDGSTYRFEYDYAPDVFRVPVSSYYCNCGDKLKSAKGYIYQEQPADGATKVLSYGLSIPATLYCDSDGVVCSVIDNSQYSKVVGGMVRKKAIEILLANILKSTDVNRYTLLTDEGIQSAAEAALAEYSNSLVWLRMQGNFNVDNFCITCGNQMRVVNMYGKR